MFLLNGMQHRRLIIAWSLCWAGVNEDMHPPLLAFGLVADSCCLLYSSSYIVLSYSMSRG